MHSLVLVNYTFIIDKTLTHPCKNVIWEMLQIVYYLFPTCISNVLQDVCGTLSKAIDVAVQCF